jgi:chorismate mutase/prephenate dehydratase
MKRIKQNKTKNMNCDSSIENLRGNIDGIDEKILELINQRLLVSKEIGSIKVQKGNKIVDRGREHELLERLTDMNKGPLTQFQ